MRNQINSNTKNFLVTNSAFYENILLIPLNVNTYCMSNALLQQHSLYSIFLLTKQAKESKPDLKIVAKVYC